MTHEQIIEQILTRKVRLSYSALSSFKRSPEHFIEYKTAPRKETPALVFGSALHCYVLRNEDFNKEFTVYNPNNKPVKDKDFKVTANKEWKNEFFQMAANKKLTVITEEQMETIKLMNDKLYFHEPSKNLLEYTRAEFEKEYKFTRKKINFISYLDIDADIFLADLKTTTDADPGYFSREIYYNGYDLQPAVYNDAVLKGRCNFQKLKEFYFIAIEKTPPFGVSVYVFKGRELEFAFEEYLGLLDKFNNCLDNPELFERTYDFYAKDQINKIFRVELPSWKSTL